MPSVRVEIVRFTDAHQPGFVECRIVDVHGRAWTFEEKVPLVTAEHLDADSAYPQPGHIGCTVLVRRGDTVRVGVDPLSGYFECDVPAALLS